MDNPHNFNPTIAPDNTKRSERVAKSAVVQSALYLLMQPSTLGFEFQLIKDRIRAALYHSTLLQYSQLLLASAYATVRSHIEF